MTCELTIKVDPDGRETQVAVTGVLDASSSNACLKQLLQAMHATCPSLVVDLSQTTLVDAAGLGILASARGQAATLGGRLRLTGVPGYLWPMIAAQRSLAGPAPDPARAGRRPDRTTS